MTAAFVVWYQQSPACPWQRLGGAACRPSGEAILLEYVRRRRVASLALGGVLPHGEHPLRPRRPEETTAAVPTKSAGYVSASAGV